MALMPTVEGVLPSTSQDAAARQQDEDATHLSV
jgi:hypothetical protein